MIELLAAAHSLTQITEFPDLYRLLFIMANVGITIAYIFLTFKILPSTNPLTWQRKIGGIIFFFTCGLTHLFMALMTLYAIHWHDSLPFWFWFNHVFQFFGVWLYIWGLYIEVVKMGKQ